MNDNTIYICLFCNKDHTSKMSLSQHSRLCRHNPNRAKVSNNFNNKTQKHICRFCNVGMNKKSLNKHEIWCGKNPNLEYVIEFYNSGKKNPNHYVKARMLGEELPLVSEETRELFRKAGSSRKHSEESKLKISKSRKKFLNDNPDKHPWKYNNKFISIPCEQFKEKLRLNKINFEEEFKVLDNRSFSVDIAFPLLKMGTSIMIKMGT